jgi:mediator of RNA polymerase II transcription subunit 17, fungi type
LVGAHAHEKAQRLGSSEVTRAAAKINPPKSPLILQPIIDLIQYHVFCERIKIELDKTVNALLSAGVPTRMRFNAVGDCGEHVVTSISEVTGQKIGGDAILRIDERCYLRMKSYRFLLNQLMTDIHCGSRFFLLRL